MSGKALVKLALGLALLVVVLPPAAQSRVKVHLSGGFEEIQSTTRNNVDYISLSELVEILGGQLDWEEVGFRISYKESDYRFDFLLGSSLISLNDTVYNLTYPVSLEKGQLFVPVATFLPYLDRVNERKLSWDGRNQELRIDAEFFNVTDVAFLNKANGFLIEIFLTTALPYEVWVSEGNWINVSIRGGHVNRSKVRSRLDRRFLYNLKAHQLENEQAQVSLRLRRDVKNWHHKLVQNPPRIQISVADVDFQLDTGDAPGPIGPDDKIDVIVVDAGHGGQDYGAIGEGGGREKDVCLGIAQRLAKLIRNDKQFKVIMTRDRDETVSLEKRAAIANSAGADLFVSIHANASPKRKIGGWNVFFLAPARNDSARSVAQLENSYFLREQSALETHRQKAEDSDDVDPILSILNEMIMTEFQTESHDFALMVDREFRSGLKTPARGIDQAAFFVLNRVYTPSVLIESAFISNKTEEKLLRSKQYQQAVAESLYRAIKRFRSKYESD